MWILVAGEQADQLRNWVCLIALTGMVVALLIGFLFKTK